MQWIMTNSLQRYLDRLDFAEMERVLSLGIRECVANVGTAYASDEFYGFALDCNFSVGAVYFSLASRSTLATIGVKARMSQDEALSADSLRDRVWSIGDWPLYCVNDRFAPLFVDA